ncbi:Short-chain dehydrogenase/reductase SDR? [hydrothermal vent metagenome]|uniref:Short-chain dehydrogenase/reductase SDR n=1 Tax=hydrothermal vent metagenome TaxID=652676 RepID=A0A3B0U6C9_9ZZZZ
MQIKNSTAIVTGANRGLGRALVDALLNQGAAKIYATARSQKSLGELELISPKITPVLLEVTDPGQIAELAGRTKDATLLINNAAILDFGAALESEQKTIEHNLEVNLFGLLNLTRAIAPNIAKNDGGAVVNILTLLSLASMPAITPYNISKAAAWSLTLSLRAELAASNISVHSVFPGAIDTDMIAGVEMDKTAPRDVAAAIVEGINQDKEDIFPDAMAQQVYQAWSKDHKAVEKQFASM